ncbi:MAG: hypothetical protein GEU79_04355 [Acidimicrobiia bacterium]|nr:hypothetical protein [Acidimicrobiia bacterium]
MMASAQSGATTIPERGSVFITPKLIAGALTSGGLRPPDPQRLPLPTTTASAHARAGRSRDRRDCGTPGLELRWPHLSAFRARVLYIYDVAMVSPHQHVKGVIGEGSGRGTAFFGSLISGALIGWLLDLWLGTSPWLVVVGIALGAYSGFHAAWRDLNAEPPTVSSLSWGSGLPNQPDDDVGDGHDEGEASHG